MSKTEERIQVTGACKYCHQQVMLMMPKSATEADIETEATRSCKCEEGEAARLRMYN